MPYDASNIDADIDIDIDIDMDTNKPPPPHFRCDAVLLCAGEGSRFRSSETNQTTNQTTQLQTTQPQTTQPQTSKLLVLLGGKPALQHLCEKVKNASFARIVLVLPKDNAKAAGAAKAAKAISALASKSLPDLILVEGGERRQDSLQKALEALEALETNNNNHGNDWVVVFDAARPLVSAELVARVLLQAQLLWQRAVSACVVPLLPVADSVKRVCEQGKVSGSVERATLRLAQTPQAAPRGLLLRLLRSSSATVSDEAQLCEEGGCQVEAVEGEAVAHKITTCADVGILEGVAGLRDRTTRHEHPRCEYRSATGFDTHKTCEGSSLRLCGVDVPALFSLEGHSDADVALHALTDAVLSLAGAGDIGDLFPPSDERWRDADSAFFLVRAMELLEEAGGELVSVDVTLLLELPHLGKFKIAMRERVAVLCGLAGGRVGVKATTLEGLGALGRGEGVGAFATASARFG